MHARERAFGWHVVHKVYKREEQFKRMWLRSVVCGLRMDAAIE